MIDFGWQRFYIKVYFKLHARLIEASILVEIRGKYNIVIEENKSNIDGV
jgi:hypothetical protein